MEIRRAAVLLAFASTALATPALAIPDACVVDADCGGYGLVCLERTYGVCGEDAGGVDPEDCSEETVHLCGPTTCTSDAACTGGTSCVTFTQDSCEGCDPDDPESEDCEDECEVTSESYCVPPFLAPCAVDADCGPGFTCEAEVECSGGYDPATDTYTEECLPTGESRCEFTAVECTNDAECGAGLGCEALGMTRDCEVECDGEEDCDEDCEEDEVSYCASPVFAAWSKAMRNDAGGADGEGEELGAGGDDTEASSGCTAAGSSAASLLGLLGVALVLRRR